MAANFNFKLHIFVLLIYLNYLLCMIGPYKITSEQSYYLKTHDLAKFGDELRSFGQIYYIKFRWSFKHVAAQSNKMLNAPLVRVNKHGLVTLELPRKLFWTDLTIHMDVQSNLGPCQFVKCSKFNCVISSLRNSDTACDQRPKYSRHAQELFGLKAKYHVPEHLYHLLKCEGILRTRRNRAGVSTRTKLRTIPVLTRTGMYKSTKTMNRAANLHNICPIDVNNSQSQQNRNNQFVPSLLLSNVMSLAPKMDEIRVFLSDYDFDLCCFTETWLRPAIDDYIVNINNYTIIRKDRTHSQHGGVCIYIRNEVKFEILRDYEDPERAEVLWVKILPQRLPRGYSTGSPTMSYD